MLGVGHGLGKQLTHVVVVQPVDGVALVALSDDESEVAKYAQLLGDRGLLHSDVAGQVTHGAGSGTQATEDVHPAWSRQRLHGIGHGMSHSAVEEGGVRLASVAHSNIIA